MLASHAPPSGGLACNPGMCPDWELNLHPGVLQAGTQSTEPHQSGQYGAALLIQERCDKQLVKVCCLFCHSSATDPPTGKSELSVCFHALGEYIRHLDL